jgi:hypothetical protein
VWYQAWCWGGADDVGSTYQLPCHTALMQDVYCPGWHTQVGHKLPSGQNPATAVASRSSLSHGLAGPPFLALLGQGRK